MSTSAVEIIRRMHDHRLWVRTRLLEVGSALPETDLRRTFPIGLGSVHASLAHLYGAEFVWEAALGGEIGPRFPQPDDFPDLASLLRAWSDLDERWAVRLAALDAAELARPVTRRNLAGVVMTTPARDVYVHVCMHAFYHTAQLVNMLRHLGVSELPETNFITYAREGH
ncbi:MAG TPA: DinB family protein [Phycisphaerales bacterium]|nr:DinB family protein [Phycisphaerales bacterium]HMP38546.1 DinB family protein [Phycisphaerales bacterium]